jgi:hypothetical protein
VDVAGQVHTSEIVAERDAQLAPIVDGLGRSQRQGMAKALPEVDHGPQRTRSGVNDHTEY